MSRFSSLLAQQEQTYSRFHWLGGRGATGAPLSWRWTRRGAVHRSRRPAAGPNTEGTCGRAGWLRAGWSTAREAAPGCWRRGSQAGTETCRHSQHSWKNPSGSCRKASSWGTPTSCWPSSGGARTRQPGWETGWAGCSQGQSCGDGGRRGS